MRMQDTLTLFREVVNSFQIKDKPIVLLLNKVDIFKEKVRRKGIEVFFKEYKGADA